MFRSKPTLLKRAVTVLSSDLPCLQNAVCVQQAQGYRPRKPMFSGIAKSKLFRIPSRPNHPPDEFSEILRISNRYRLYMRSISNFYKLENESRAAGSAKAAETLDAEEVEWQESLQKIKQWNEDVAAKRNERLENQRREKELQIKETILEENRKQEERLKEIEEMVRKEKELSKSYITSENIDRAIEEVLEKNVDFNYAIDVRGKRYEGRYVTASGEEEMPQGETEEEALAPLFQSSPISGTK